MVATNIRLPMRIDNGSGIGTYSRLNFNISNNSIPVPLAKKKLVRRLRMDLNTSMIGRIANAPSGCGSCGGGGY